MGKKGSVKILFTEHTNSLFPPKKKDSCVGSLTMNLHVLNESYSLSLQCVLDQIFPPTYPQRSINFPWGVRFVAPIALMDFE